jgi:uncharacterized protein (DUF934 family)
MLLKFENTVFTTADDEALVYATVGEDVPANADGLDIPADVDVTELDLDFSQFTVIRLQFAAYKDGRAFSQARLLRDRFGFTGDIRAGGEVLRDQALFMVRCGFTSFELPASESLTGFAASVAEFSEFYQPASRGAAPVWQLRQGAAQAGRLEAVS